MGRLFAEAGLSVVFIGSTAVVGLGLYPRTSRDADALAPPATTMEEARSIVEAIAKQEGLDMAEKGWGTIAAVKRDEAGQVLWEVDLLVPGEGPITSDAARRIHAKAKRTAIGRTAIAEHVLATKAIAYGDSLGMGDPEGARRYEGDLLEFRKALPSRFEWPEVGALLSAYQETRARAAAEKIHQVFGRKLRLE